MALLAIDSDVEYNEIITGMEFHSHMPYASTNFKNNDEIRIPISQQDIITAPFDSTLHISGKIEGKKQGGTAAVVKLVNNAIAFLFDDIRYEIGGIEVDRTKNVGIASTIKNLLSVRQDEEASLKNACWLGPGKSEEFEDFSFSVPLKLLLGFAEDYKRIVVNVKQELVLLRSASDLNAVISEDAANHTITISNIYWRVPHITVSDTLRLKLLRMIEKDTSIHLPFRTWELHEYPLLPTTTIHSWSIRTSNTVEKPRYVILAFQTNRKNQMKSDMALFDHCGLQNVKLYLNSQYYPYDNVRGDMCIFYEMFLRFQNSYYDKPNSSVVSLATFKEHTPLYVIDCSKQNDSIKAGAVDVRLEFETKNNIDANTTAYCLILHDSHLVYNMLTGMVKKVM